MGGPRRPILWDDTLYLGHSVLTMLRKWTAMHWTVVALLLTIGVAVTARAIGAGATPEPSFLQTITPQDLRKGGVELRAPTAPELATARVSREQAEEQALYQFSGGKILEARLLIAKDTFADNGITCFCWVISSDPDADPYIHQPVPFDGQPPIRVVADKSYRLDFVDAVTGKWLYGAEHSGVHNETLTQPKSP